MSQVKDIETKKFFWLVFPLAALFNIPTLKIVAPPITTVSWVHLITTNYRPLKFCTSDRLSLATCLVRRLRPPLAS